MSLLCCANHQPPSEVYRVPVKSYYLLYALALSLVPLSLSVLTLGLWLLGEWIRCGLPGRDGEKQAHAPVCLHGIS